MDEWRKSVRVRYLVLLLGCLGGVAQFIGAAPTHPLLAQSPHQIALVVDHGNGTVTTRCVEFSEPHLSGYEVLGRAGLDLSTAPSGMGPTICRIDGTGCDGVTQPCFCAREYWSYWQVHAGQWTYSQQGASLTTVLPGSIEGWRWDAGSSATDAATPPLIGFEEICQVAAPTPTFTATMPPTLTPLPTATDAPTPTPTLTETPAPTLTPTATPWPSATATFIPATATPTWTATATWTPSPTVSPLAVEAAALIPPTWTPAPPPVEVVTAATTSPLYAAWLPLVHGQAAVSPPAAPDIAPTGTMVIEAAPVAPILPAEVSAPPPAIPTAAPLPPSTPLVIIVTATPTQVILVPMSDATAPVVAAVPSQPVTEFPAATPVPPLNDYIPALLGVVAVGGIVLFMPVGLALLVLMVYVIARRL